MSRWFRHYAGMMRDDKLVSVAIRAKQPVERVVWVWGAILESAAEINDGGRYDFDCAEAAYFLRCDVSDLEAAIGGLEQMGRIAAGRVCKWGERQYDSDTSRERQQRYRDRHKPSPRNDSDVTPPSRDAEVTLQETDTDTDTELKREPNGSPKKRGSRIPEDWVPDEAEAVEAGLPRQGVSLEASKFRDYWRSLPGQRGVKLDWPATWRNWCRKAASDARPRPYSTGSPIGGSPKTFDEGGSGPRGQTAFLKQFNAPKLQEIPQ